MNIRAILRFERSVLFLILANVFTIAVALLEHWNLSEVLWIYWGQSVIIGFYNWRRILCLKQFSTDGITEGRSHYQPRPTKSNQRQHARLFAAHYGLFHFIYFSFLLKEQSDLTRLGIFSVVVCIAIFAVNNHFSFRRTVARDSFRTPRLGTIMMFPYARILPMHLTMMLGESAAHHTKPTTALVTTLTLILFLVLKTLADVVMHLVEHRETSQSASRPVAPVDPVILAKWVKRVRITLAGIVGSILFLVLWIAFAGIEKWPAIVSALLALGSVVAIMAIVYGLFWVMSLPVMSKRNSVWGNVICVLVGLVLAAIIAFVLTSVTSVSKKQRHWLDKTTPPAQVPP